VAKNKQENFGLSRYIFIDSKVTGVQRVRYEKNIYGSKRGGAENGEAGLDGRFSATECRSFPVMLRRFRSSDRPSPVQQFKRGVERSDAIFPLVQPLLSKPH
jgi:hypothetical protein